MNKLLYELDLMEEHSSIHQFQKRRHSVYEAELEDLFLDDIWDSVRSGASNLWSRGMVAQAIASGERNQNKLTDRVFYARHPELGGRAIRKNEKTLMDEWLIIRNSIVRPMLSDASRKPSKRPKRPPSGGTTSTAIDGRTLRNNIARIAKQEWKHWGRGRRKESDEDMHPTLRAYWRQAKWSWIPKKPKWSEKSWSAAFISWVMNEAGAGNAFRYSGRHTDYVGAAKRNKVAKNNNPFKAYLISKFAPRVGDLVCNERENSGVTYDNVDKGRFISHCDIVVEVQPGQIKTIGGNAGRNSDSVKMKTLKTDSSGRLIQRSKPGKDFYAVVRVGD